MIHDDHCVDGEPSDEVEFDLFDSGLQKGIMFDWIICECGMKFWGTPLKEDTCPDCLKKIMEKEYELHHNRKS